MLPLLLLLSPLLLADDAPRAALPLASEPAPAQISKADQAEYYRLHDECIKLSRRQVWPGVERLYLGMEATGASLVYEDYLAGAMSARDAGDVLLAYERLTAAAKLNGTREVIDWLWSIDTAYGRVELRTEPLGPAELSVESMPILPDQRAAIEAAQRHLKEGGSYAGMLPAGTYTFAGQEFTVTPGPKEVLILVRPVDEKKRGRAEEEPNPVIAP
ncbi:MAG: hypothetical protein ACI9VR_005247 [Cognaticolwellia sp.]